ncbi:Protein CBR-SMA-1 [Caenorhabditis briggsae]|uniref:Protein CBR-SMA-1 n=1 Tax=Caenorhabditis briggsae TaxID=6238 RepID=A8Y467_CAEBR|nr:Protein CBR-SMA-1 [Caenorhabditis briggsae]CAP39687.2 Protein CBR-SMA-1 [Caenorhabditis briggsae]
MSYVSFAASYSPGEGKTVRNLNDKVEGYRKEIAPSRENVDFEHLRRTPRDPQPENDYQTTSGSAGGDVKPYQYRDYHQHQKHDYYGEGVHDSLGESVDNKDETMRKYEMQVRVPTSGAPPVRADASGTDQDEFNNETLYFERSRIRTLQDERVHIQKKTFTKWCNSFLNRASLEIVDLFEDVGDGILLMKLLEIISGDKLGKPNRGRMRVQKVENLNKVLDFLKKKKIQLENIGAEDILDRNERLILGLIWTIILRFQIDTIVIEDEEERGERKHAKDALLLWCQRKTAGYPNVRIENFTTSWRNGLAFNALIHSHRPDLVDFNRLNPNEHVDNLNHAFDVAEKKLEIARLLDAEDVDVTRPDEKSIITYVSLYYHHFAKQKTEMTGARRIANIVGKLMVSETMEDDYEHIASELLNWIRITIKTLESRRFPNSLNGMRDEHAKFNQFRTSEKPPKYKEKGELEALFFTIQTKRKAMSRKQYQPPQGLFMHDIESAWAQLDYAENERQVSIIAELQRQEKLEQLAQRFHKKAKLRDSWLKSVQVVLEEMEHGRSASQVEKTLKKQQAISTDILAREDRFKMLTAMCNELCTEKYHESEKIRGMEREIIDRWTQLLALLEQRKRALMSLNDLMSLLRDIDTLSNELYSLEPAVRNRDVGKHLIGVEDLLGKHDLVDAQINAHGSLLSKLSQAANNYIRHKEEQFDVLQRKLDEVTSQYNTLVELCRSRRLALERARSLFQFIQDHEEEMAWLAEKEKLCTTALNSGDISAVPQTTLLYKNVEMEMQTHWARSKGMIAGGERLVQSGQSKEDIQRRLTQMNQGWERLRVAVDALGNWLSEARHAQQYFQDVNEAESWIREKMPLVKSDDLGRDEGAAESLLQRHARLEEEIRAYKNDITRLEEMQSQLANSAFHTATTSQSVQETEEVTVPQIEMAYKYEGNGMRVAKGEVLALLEKSTPEWWRALKRDGTEGYVPANYCKVVPGESVTVTQTTQKTTTTVEGNETKSSVVAERQHKISNDYRELRRLADVRRRLLSDNIKLLRFYRELSLADEPSPEHVTAFRRKFDKLEADMKTNGGTQLKHINDIANDLISEGHGQSRQIENRQHKINAMWENLERLRKQRAVRLEATERVADFDTTCESAREWMLGKFEQLDRNPNDVKSLQNLERDLKPLEDKIAALEKLAAAVKKDHPEEAAAIERKIAELRTLHADLLRRAQEKMLLAEQSQGKEMFESALRDMMSWIEKTRKGMMEDVHPVDVAEAEELLKKHYELGEQIKDKKYEVEYCQELGRRLLERSPRMPKVEEQLQALVSEMAALRDLYRRRDTILKQQLDLQLFNRESERIDAATKGHEAFLEFDNLGDSVESVENLLKRHRDLEAKLDAQEARLEAFSRTADDMIKAQHADSAYIEQRRRDVLARREAVRRAAAQRKKQLEASLEYQEMRREADEVMGWMHEKAKLVASGDDAALAPSAIPHRLLKHEAFEAEIIANESRIQQINREGDNLVGKNHYESPNVEKVVRQVNAQWGDLKKQVYNKGQRLRQAADQKGLDRILEDAHAKLDEMESALNSKDQGLDLRSVKDLLQKHTVLEQEMGLYGNKLADIENRGKKMAVEGHYDADKIHMTVGDLLKRYAAMKGPAQRRKGDLDESRLWHQLVFDVDCELQWIAEKKPIASSQDCGRTLTEALNMVKKQEQLEAEVNQHGGQIDKVLGQASKLVKRHHPASSQIKAKSGELESAWSELRRLLRSRRAIVDWGVKEQQYLFDAAEVESWMNEKRNALASEDYGNDEDAARKLLAKHRALCEDMTTYRQWLEKLDVKCSELVQSDRPHVDRFQKRQDELVHEFDSLSKLAEDRRNALEDAVCLYEYMRESADLEQWIGEQLQTALCEDFAEDYEHLKELQSKFDEFKQSVKTGSERFTSCETAANTILRRNPPFARDVVKKQEKLRSAWNLLCEYIETRTAKLAVAEELHRFHRDVDEFEQWMADKMANMPRDLGRDVKHVHSLWQQHEALDKETHNAQPRLTKLVEEAERLKKAYPGGNAEQIGGRQQTLVEEWEELRNATDDRKDMLRAAFDLHTFNGKVRDLLAWTDLTISDIQSDLQINDLQQAEWLQTEHSRLSHEMDAREPEFTRLVSDGEKMVNAQHYATEEIKNKTRLLKTALERLRSEWTLRNGYLSQAVQWHAFQREAKQIIASIGSKRTTLRSLAVGGSVADVESQKKRLDTFEKALSTLDERTATLDHTANELVKSRHMESKNIAMWQSKVHEELKLLREDIEARHVMLKDAFALASFGSDVAQIEAWIDEKTNGIRKARDQSSESISIEEKMKRLQTHQALEAEVAANKTIVDQILHRGQQLKSLHRNSKIGDTCNELNVKWSQLAGACDDQSRALEEARDLLRFKQLVENVLTWINEKEVLVSTADMGRDMEHCRMLLERLDGTRSDSTVDEQTLDEINRLGEKLVKQGRTSRDQVQKEQQRLNEKWRLLLGQLSHYRTELVAAMEVHTFNRDVEDTDERIHEKIAAMKSDDFGKDFASVELLVRKQSALERDMSAIHQKLISHDKDAQKILEKRPPLKESILDSLKKLEESWKKLSEAAELRNDKLNRSFKLYKYLDDVKKTEQWANQVRNKMTSHQTPKDSSGARKLLEQHHERKAEIDGRADELRQLHEEGQALNQEQPEHKAEVQRAHKRVQNSEHQLRQTWESEKGTLQKLLEWMLWCDEAVQCEQWLADKENQVSRGELGDTSDAVEMLIKGHSAFEETVRKQSEKIDVLVKNADALVSGGNNYRADIITRKDEVTARHDLLLKSMSKRKDMLEDSKRYHEFIRHCGELIIWITAKLQLAYDESFLDHTNLRSKLQKHMAFDSELVENEKRLSNVERQGEELVADNHFMSEQVKAQLVELRSGWDELRTKSALKTQRLREAFELHSLQRKVEDLEKWLDKVEGELASEDHGRDMLSTELLIKKLDTLQTEIAGRSDAVVEMMKKARELRVQGSAAADDCLKQAEQVEARYSGLDEPVQIRRENLVDAQAFFEWVKAAEEDLEWLSDKMPLASSGESGDSLQSALSLQKKHAALEKELETRQSAMDDTEKRGKDMIRQRHFASGHIQKILDRLSTAMLTLKESCGLRRDLLQEAIDAHEYYTEETEAEQWLREQMPLAMSQEMGRDQAGAESHLRRLTVLDKEVELFKNEIDRLKKRADGLLAREHHDAMSIAAKQRKLEALFGDLCRECARRRTQIVDASKYHKFVRQADDLSDWLREKERTASAEDYGQDLEDCQQIIEQFESTVRELAAAGERVALVQRSQEDLLRSGHPYGASITAKGADVQRLWTHVNEVANERKQALNGARQVHRFDQEADQTLNWLQDKEATGVAMEQEDLSRADLASVKAQLQRHDEFMHGMKAVEKQVAELCHEAERLWNSFPDTRHHLEVRRLDMEEQLKDILEAAKKHLERLRHMQSLQSYFQEYREMMQWMKNMQTTMTSEQLPRDVASCESLVRRHDEYNLEMQGRKPFVDDFARQGRRMIQSSHVLSQEIQEKVEVLEKSWEMLCEIWKDRAELYEENMDVQKWKQNAEQLDSWLEERAGLLGDDWRMVDSVEMAESHLRDFDDFLVTLEAQNEKCEMVKRLTLVEQNFSRLRSKEIDRAKIAEEDQKRRDTIKIVEKGNILANRRQERERRKTQEISLLRPSPSGEEFSTHTMPRKERKDRAKTTADLAPGSIQIGDILATSSTVAPLQSGVEMTKTPSFTTRRPQSIRKGSRWEDMGAIDMKGFFDRKQCQQSGGKRATIRSWKNYYGILCGQLLCFFKDEQQFIENVAAAPPVYIYGAQCEQYPEYAKRKNAFRLLIQDGSEFMFSCPDERQMLEWVAKIKFHAHLTPSNQLKSYSYNDDLLQTTGTEQLPMVAPRRNVGGHDVANRLSHASSAFTGVDDIEQHELDYSRGCTSLPRGKHHGQITIRDCATLPRGFGSEVVEQQPTAFFPPSGPLLATPSVLTMSSSSMTATVVPTVVARKIGVVRRTSRRQSVYAESIYGEVEQAIAEANRVSIHAPNGDHAELRHTIQAHPGSSGYTETLMYKEHTSSSYQPMERSMSPRSTQNGEFITWVESNQHNQSMNTPDGRSTSASVVSTPSNYDDNDSIKSSSKRKGFGSLFKRGSKVSK